MSWDLYWNWSYPATVVFCLAAGFVIGWVRRGECELKKARKEALRIALTDTIHG